MPSEKGDFSRAKSQGYSTIHLSEDLDHCDDVAVSSKSSRRNSLLLEGIHQESYERNSTNIRVSLDSDNDGRGHETAQCEIAISSMDADLVVDGYRSRFQDVRDAVTRYWLWEAAACVFSLISLASIVAVLIYEDGKQLDQWAWSIPPTAVVSFIGTLGKASLVLVLSQVLSQLKWLYFSKEPRSLRHIKIFDQASRGPIGAIMIIWKSKKALTSIAACLMILTILVDPFVQLVFSFPSRLVEDSSQSAVFQYINDWDGESGDFIGTDLPSQRIWISINQGLASANITPTVTCPSGNCIWSEPIKTLAVCGSCEDVTANAQTKCSTIVDESTDTYALVCNYTFNDGKTLQAQRDLRVNTTHSNTAIVQTNTVWNSTQNTHLPNFLNLMADYQPNHTSIEFKGQNITAGSPYNDSKVDIFDGGITGLYAVQIPFEYLSNIRQYSGNSSIMTRCWSCEMYWCEQSFDNMQVVDGGPPIYTTSTQRLWNIGWNGEEYGLYPKDFETLTGPVWKLKYRMVNSLPDYLNNFFNSYYMPQYWYDGGYFYDTSLEDLARAQLDLTLYPGAIAGLALSEDLDLTFQRLADSLTETIRTGPNAAYAQGQSLVNKSFIKVRWGWLALPLVLMASTCILLMVVAIKSHMDKVTVWKDDPLALLFHHIDVLPGGAGTMDLHNLTSEMYVKLDREIPYTFIGSGGKVDGRHKREQI